MRWLQFSIAVFVVSAKVWCADLSQGPRFGDDLAFLKKHTKVIVLSDKSSQRQAALVPAYQGRIMTSTAAGPSGLSFGWVNRELIATGKFQKHINVFGGEDRFWIGPEGGQFSVFFAKGAQFTLEDWYTPAAIDTEPFKTISYSRSRAHFRRDMKLTNYSGTEFRLRVDREIKLLSLGETWQALKLNPMTGVKVVAVESVNKLTNTGNTAWTKTTGLLSIWILGMLNASPGTTVVIPFVSGDEEKLGPRVNDEYFGKVPSERLVVEDNVLFFAADAGYRSKIGIPPLRCKPILGSYDSVNKVLTLVQFTLPKGVKDYVNSMWELQENPFGGDVVNSYNDGPPAAGKPQLGKFYELETSSPALALKPKQNYTHVHRTIHLQGPEASLDKIAHATLGVGLDQIKDAIK